MEHMVSPDRIRENLHRVLARIKAAAESSGRDPEKVTLVAVTKGRPVEAARVLLEEGCVNLGENRAQELVEKMESLSAMQFPTKPLWHFIGHLQRNKVNLVVGKARLIHSVDSLRLAQAISRRALALGVTQDVLIQVNVSGEPTKYGISPGELVDFLRQASELPGISIRGLMTMAPVVSDPEATRPYFRELAMLLESARGELPHLSLDLLSMGMTQDFEVAVQEGANLVRVGTALFS